MAKPFSSVARHCRLTLDAAVRRSTLLLSARCPSSPLDVVGRGSTAPLAARRHWIRDLTSFSKMHRFFTDSSRSSIQPQPLFNSEIDSCLQIAELVGLPAAVKGSNFIFSPLSLRAALSLTAAGARGETLQQLLSFLGSPTSDHLHSASAGLLQAIHGNDEGQNLSFVNGVWVDHSIALNPSFLEITSTIYKAAAESVDFANQARNAEKKINDWVEDKTKKIIKNLIPNGTLNDLTIMVLANALYFKGKWEEPFDHSKTTFAKFYLLDGSTVQAPFMRSRETQFISSSDTFTVLKLPYKQKRQGGHLNRSSFSLLLFLPNERDGLHDLTKRVVSEPNFIEDHVPYGKVEVSSFMIPKFKLSFDFEASDALKDLGLRNIFKCGDADLSGMFLEPSQCHALFVSNVLHKAAIEVDEEGTTAAAATAVMEGGCGLYTPPRVKFVADHPFLFVVREDKTGAILFFGNLVNPLID